MSRYEKMFTGLAEKNEGAFVPFVVLGDPGFDESLSIIQTLANSGADALELGFPFSDPLADGPTIQGAMDRALAAGTTPGDCLDLIHKFRATNDEIPVGLLVYANIVYSFGIEGFYESCKSAGVDSVLIADVPLGESTAFCAAAVKSGVDPVLLCPPNIDEQALRQIATHGRGYTYLLSRAGVTGTSVTAGAPVEKLLEQLFKNNAPPPLLGFGISQPKHVSSAISAGAKGVIVGSAIVNIVERNPGNLERINRELSDFVGEMKSATFHS